MGIITRLKEFILPNLVVYYILQPGGTYWIKDMGVELSIGGMENELRLQEKILMLKKSKLLIPKFNSIPIKTMFGMKKICFAYMPNYNSILPVDVHLGNQTATFDPEDFNIQYLRGTIRTYQDLQFKEQSFFEKFFLPIIFIVGMIVLGVFLRMTLDRIEGITQQFARIEASVGGIAGQFEEVAEKIPETAEPA